MSLAADTRSNVAIASTSGRWRDVIEKVPRVTGRDFPVSASSNNFGGQENASRAPKRGFRALSFQKRGQSGLLPFLALASFGRNFHRCLGLLLGGVGC